MPKNWKTYKLGDIASFSYGKMPKKALLGKGEYPTFSGYKYQYQYPEFNVLKGDLIVVARGVGGTGDVKLVKEKSYLTNLSIKINLDQKILTNIYFYFKFLINNLRYLDSGSAQSQLTINDLSRIDITIPPLLEQIQIANILSAIDDKIENNLAINKTLEDMAMALYKHWFVDFDFPITKESHPELVSGSQPIGYKTADGEFIDSELGPIPKGWEVKKFNDLIEKIIDNRGKTPPLSKEKTNYLLLETYQLSRASLFPSEIKNNKAKYVTEEIYNNPKWFRKGHPKFMDILFATVGNGIPNWSIMYENDGVGIAQNVVGIRPKTNITSAFMRYSFESKLFLEQFDGYIITTAQPSIKLSDLNMIDMLLPTQEVRDKWNKQVNTIVQQVYSNYKENQTLTQLRDTLLPKLISGEVRLKEFRDVIANAVKQSHEV